MEVELIKNINLQIRMSEILSVHIGGAGTKVGLQYWKSLQKDSLFSNPQDLQEKHANLTHKFYDENSKGEKIPRCIFADTDTRTESYLKNNNTLQHSFSAKSVLTHEAPTNNIFGQGFYNSSNVLVADKLLETFNKQVEKCDRFSGIIVTQSCSGGTGSGTGASFMQKMRQNYPGIIFQLFPINPGKEDQYISTQNLTDPSVRSKRHIDMGPLGVYNTVFNMYHQIEQTDIVYNFQNKAVTKLLINRDGNHKKICYKEVNQYMGRCISEHTAAYRYPGPLNTNQRKRATNLILFPRIKFMRCGLSRKKQKDYLFSAMDDNQQMMYGVNRNQRRALATAVHIRDPFCYESEIDERVRKKNQNLNNIMCQWIPSPIHVSISEQINQQWGPSAWFITNGANNVQWIKNLGQIFTAQFRRKAFLHHYTSIGMDQMQFTEAQSNVNDLLSQYVPCSGCYSDFEEEFDQEQM